MKKIFFFETPSDAVGHGIGTYANHLVQALGQKDRPFKFFFVKITFNEADEMTTKKINGCVDEINISFNDKLIKPNVEVPIKPILARKIFCLLSDLFEDPREVVFHLNFVLQYEIGKLAKEYDFKLVYTSHISLWRVFYENDYQKFLKVWNDKALLNNVGLVGDKNYLHLNSILFEKKLCQTADNVVCLTEDSRRFIKEHYSNNGVDKYLLIPNGLNLQVVSRTFNSRTIKKRMGFSESDFIFLFVGRMNKQKGLDALIDAFQKILKTIANAKLLIVGTGNFEQYTKLCSSFCGRVVFSGYVDKSKIDQYYQIADVGLVPSYTEQSSYVVMEMLSHQIPLIVSDIPAFDAPFQDGHNVIKVKTNVLGRVNVNGLAHKMKQAHQDAEWRKQIARGGKKLFDEHFTADQMAEKTLAIYFN
jgi:glycosyltransferase involved in cell wall biosynthesis